MLDLAFYEQLASEIRLDNDTTIALTEWERMVAADLVTGVRETHIRIPEENGKTTFMAVDNLIHLATHPRPRAVIAARNKPQAKILFHQMVAMVVATPALDRILLIREGTNEIRVRGKRGDVGVTVIPADELSAHGGINTRVTIDEMHALPGLGLYHVLAGKLGKRAGAQLITISTAGEPDSEYEQMWAWLLSESPTVESRGPRVLRAAGENHVAWSWALEKDDDVDDPAVVKLANPSPWITEETLRTKRNLPSFEPKHWRTVVCNLPTRDFEARFLPEGDWDVANVSATISELPEGVPIIAGGDWGWTDDATVIVPLWQEDDLLLIAAPTILEPPRNGTDLAPQDVLDAILAIDARNPIVAFAHDESSFGGGKVMTGLLQEALPNAQIIPVTARDQADAAGYFLEQLRNGRLKHTGDPDLKRHLMNAIRKPVQDDPERFRLARPKASRGAPHQRAVREIDGAVAATLAVWGAIGVDPVDEPFATLVGSPPSVDQSAFDRWFSDR
jgi:phage terminase large subunit-like protein